MEQKKSEKKGARTTAKKVAVTVSAQYERMTTQQLEAAMSEMQTALSEKKKAQAESIIKDVVKNVIDYAEFFSAYDKRKIAKALGFDTKADEAETVKVNSATIYKYQLDDGQVWTGKGRMPKAFKAWKEQNPGEEFPIHPISKRGQEAVWRATAELENVE